MPNLNVYGGTSLRGIDIRGGREKDIVVEKALDPAGVAALVSGGGYLWVGDTATDHVYRIDPRTEEIRPFSLRQSADVLMCADGSLWVLDTLGGKITRVDPKTGHFLHSYAIAGDLQSMAVGGGYVWVTDASGDDIQRIPEDLASPSTAIPVGQIGGPPRAIAYDDGAIVVGFTGAWHGSHQCGDRADDLPFVSQSWVVVTDPEKATIILATKDFSFWPCASPDP